MDGITGAQFVVGLRLFVVEPENVYRVEASVQIKLAGINFYEQQVERFTTWAEAVAWLGGLLPAGVATTPLATVLSTFRES